jgi:hypothetical protein
LVVETVEGLEIFGFDGVKTGKNLIIRFEGKIFGLRKDFDLDDSQRLILPKNDLRGTGI